MMVFQAVATKKESLQYFQDMTRSQGLPVGLAESLMARTEKFIAFAGTLNQPAPAKSAAKPEGNAFMG